MTANYADDADKGRKFSDQPRASTVLSFLFASLPVASLPAAEPAAIAAPASHSTDSVEWFKQHGGLKRENGDRFRRTVLSRGGSEEAMTLFRNFSDREPSIAPLLKRRGLEPPAAAGSP